MKELFVPALGMAMEECTLVEWLKQPGDEVLAGERVAVIETDKSTLELEAPVAGRLGPHLFAAGAAVPVGRAIAHIFEGGEQLGALEGATASVATSSDRSAQGSGGVGGVGVEGGSRVEEFPARGLGGQHRLSPRERRLAAEAGAVAGDDEFGGRHRAAVALAVSASWRDIPHFGVTSHVHADVLMESVNRAREKNPQVTVTDLLLRAFALALSDHGRVGTGAIGLAVATSRGVSIPVVHDVPSLGLAELVQARVDAIDRARSAKMSVVDGESPGFSISNLGVHDVESFTGVIPVNQKGLLTVGKVKERPVAIEGVLLAKRTLYATLNVDHRVLDGAHVAAILDTFSQVLNDAARLIGRQEG